MSVGEEQVEAWLHAEEDEHVEFKRAEREFDARKLAKYCVALANERGGHLVLGITNKRPREVAGSQAFAGRLEKTLSSLRRRIPQLYVEGEELEYRGKRIVVFCVGGRPEGVPLEVGGSYLQRDGEELAPMRPQQLQAIFAEHIPDFSAETVRGATLDDIDPESLAVFRDLWLRKSGNKNLENESSEHLLSDAGLVTNEGVTYAALVLLGNATALRRYLANAELIYEYRSRDNSIEYQDRRNYRRAFLTYAKDLESQVDARNDIIQMQDGFLVRDLRTLNPGAVREAILNAVTHRDYRHPGSIFVRHTPTQIVVESPGGLLPGITIDNILERQAHRNRLIAETLERCGFVERSGQGMNRIFESAVEEGKPEPSFDGTDSYQVVITLDGTVDPHLVRFLEEIGKETLRSFNTWDYLAVRNAYLNRPLPPEQRERAKILVQRGILERTGHARGTRYVPSQRFHRFLGEEADYTRRIGLDKETNKQLLLKHIRVHSKNGTPLGDLVQVLPGLDYRKVQRLVFELRDEGKLFKEGEKRGARWFLSPLAEGDIRSEED